MLAFLKKWWKYLLGFTGAIIVFIISFGNKRKWGEFHRNSVENLEGELSAAKKATDDLERESEKINKDFSDGLKILEDEKKRNVVELNEAKEKAKEEIKKNGIAKAIADLLNAEYVEKD